MVHNPQDVKILVIREGDLMHLGTRRIQDFRSCICDAVANLVSLESIKIQDYSASLYFKSVMDTISEPRHSYTTFGNSGCGMDMLQYNYARLANSLREVRDFASGVNE